MPAPNTEGPLENSDRGIRGCAEYVTEITGRSCSRNWVRNLVQEPEFRRAVEALAKLLSAHGEEGARAVAEVIVRAGDAAGETEA